MTDNQISVVPIEVIQDKRLTLEQTRVLVALFSFRNKVTNTVWPSRAAIAERTGMHTSNISSATTALVALGWLTKEGLGGHSKSTRYTLCVPAIEAPKQRTTVARSATVAESATVARSATSTVAHSATPPLADSATRKEQSIEQSIEEKEKVAQKETLKKISFEEGTFININDAQVATWTAAYPAANVPAEILRAAAWLDANPSKKSDCKRFLNGWLSRAQDNAPRAAVGEQAKPKNTSAPAFALPEWINQSHWDAWHSTAKRKNASPAQKQMAVEKLDDWRQQGIDHALALENAAIGGWQGLFKPDLKTTSYPPTGHHANRHAGAAVAIWGNPEPTQHWGGECIDV